MDWKKKLVKDVQEAAQEYDSIIVFRIMNMRISGLNELRKKFRDSKFFLGKNKVVAIALGKNPQSEIFQNIHKVSERLQVSNNKLMPDSNSQFQFVTWKVSRSQVHLKSVPVCINLQGECGLLFTSKMESEAVEIFDSFSQKDFARSGATAVDTVELEEGPLEQFAHSLEPHLRSLGMPTALKKGVVTLIKDYTVCKAGQVLTPEQARILVRVLLHFHSSQQIESYDSNELFLVSCLETVGHENGWI